MSVYAVTQEAKYLLAKTPKLLLQSVQIMVIHFTLVPSVRQPGRLILLQLLATQCQQQVSQMVMVLTQFSVLSKIAAIRKTL